MKNIQTISIEKLKKDLKDSYYDIAICKKAITLGIKQYSGGLTQQRLDGNKHFVKVITAELKRRQEGGRINETTHK